MNFLDINLPTYVLNGLQLQNINTLTEIQKLCIPKILEGADVVGQSQTGSGKTFAYGIPAICKVDAELLKPQVLIVCPTRELAAQVCNEIKNITKNSSIKVVPIFGGVDMNRQIVALKKCNIVVGTPGRLMDHLRRRTLKLNEIKMVVLDEADEMLNMGFKEDVETILKGVPKTKQMVMFSATMPKPILEITKNYMTKPNFIKVENGVTNQQFVEQYFVNVLKTQKNEAILKLIKTQKPKTLIIFCNTKKMVDNLCDFLKLNKINAVCMHGDKRQSERKRILDGIKKNGEGVLIGTDVLARGIDITNVDAVYNYDLPQNSEYYIHRIGRTARAGKQGKSITIINTKKQFIELKELEKATNNKIVEIKLDLENYNNNIARQVKTNSQKQTEQQINKIVESKKDNKNFVEYYKTKKYGKRKPSNNLKENVIPTKKHKESNVDGKVENKFINNKKTSNKIKSNKSANNFKNKNNKNDDRKFDSSDKDFFSGKSTRTSKKTKRDFKKFLK